LVARTAGGREVAGSSPVTPTMISDQASVWSLIMLSAVLRLRPQRSEVRTASGSSQENLHLAAMLTWQKF
jgi:hypothetical protein